jgi:drug/metabolite transporter (DMT)-like permease
VLQPEAPLTTGVVLAVLVAALMHASWNALIRGASDKGLYTVVMHVGSAVLALVLLPFVGLPRWESAPFVAASAGLHTLYILLLMRSYDGSPLAVSYLLMRGLAPLLVCLVSAPLLGESLSHAVWLGVCSILTGVWCIAKASGLRWREVLSHPSGKAAVLNAFVIAAYTLVDGQGVRVSGNPVGYVLILALLEPWIVVVYQWVRRPQALGKYFRQYWAWGLFGGLVATSAYAIVLWAMTLAPIAVVAALRESSVIFAVLIGYLWFKEGRLRPGLIAAGMVAIGVSLVKL